MNFLKRLFGSAVSTPPPKQTTARILPSSAPVAEPSKPASPTPPPKDEDLSYEALVDELVSLSQTGFYWGLQHRFPAVKDYPQYPRVRRLGELIYTKAGHKGMQEACRILQRRVKTRDGGGQAWLAEYGWEGIGDWRP